MRRGIDEERVDHREGLFEGPAAMDTGPVVEDDADPGLALRSEFMDQQRTVESLGGPREEMQTVARYIGPQSAPLARGIIAVHPGVTVAWHSGPGRPDGNEVRRHRRCAGRVHDDR